MEEPDSVATVSCADGASGELVITIAGELDISNAEATRAAIDASLNGHPRAVVFDLKDLRFMDSSGIATLLGVAVRVDSVHLRNPSPIIRRVVEATGIADVLPTEP